MSCNFDANYSLKKREVEPWNFTICKPKQRKEKISRYSVNFRQATHDKVSKWQLGYHAFLARFQKMLRAKYYTEQEMRKTNMTPFF